MNKSYKIIWSEAQNGWAVASEIAAGRGKCKGGRAAVRRSRAAGLAAGGLMLAAGSAQAAPASDQLIQIRPGLDAGASSVKPAQARDPGDMAIGASSVAQSSTPSGSGDPNFWHAATAVGYGSHAIGDRTSAFGLQADASAEHATSIGAQSKAVGKTSTALGARAQASGDSAIAAGADARASGYRSVSIGTRSSATADGTLSLGNDAAALAAYSAAMGNQATATGRNSVALGAKSVADRADTISVGTDSYKRQITNVKAGVQETDAVNVAQLSEVAVLAAQGNRYFKAQGLSDGSDDAQASALRAVAIGAGAHANATNTVALGAGSVADRDNSVSVGTQGQQRQITNLAAGSSRTDAVNVGQLNDAIQNVTGGGNNSIADAVMYDDAASHASVTLKRNGGGSVALRNIAAGTADTDAVNLKQLTDAGLKVDGNGNVKGAFVAYDSETKDLVTLAGAKGGTTITNLKAGKADLDAVNIKQLKDAGLLTEDPVTGDQVGLAVSYDNGNRDDITLKGKTGTIIHNVASGKAQHDAVNVLQMQQAGVLGDDGVANQVVLFNGANGEANAAGKKLINLSKGESDTDAVTVKQLKDAVASGMVEPTKLDFLAVNSKGGSPVAVAKGYDGIALGTDAQVAERATNGIAIGAGASADGSNSVALGAGANTAGRQNVVSVGSITTSTNPSIPPVEDTRQIIHVAAGTQATDAVNVSQLTGVTQALGGGAGIDSATGKLNAPKYTIGGKDYSNVGDALQAASAAGGANPLAVSYDDDTKAKITLNSGGSAAAITNVANGRSASDAVNLAQLKDTVSTLGGGATIDAEGKVKAPTYTVKGLDGKDGTYSDVGSAVDALNANMSNMAPNLKYIKFGVSTAAQAQATGTDAVALGGNAFAMGDHAVAVGRGARAQGDDAIAFGYGSNVPAERSLAFGVGAVVTQPGSVAIGYNSEAHEANTVSVGNKDNARRIVNVADGVGEKDAVNLGQVTNLLKEKKPSPELAAELGPQEPGLVAHATGTESVAIGGNSFAMGSRTIAISRNARAQGDDAIAIGYRANAPADGAMALGVNSSASYANSVALGFRSVATEANTVSVGNSTLQRRIVNVADGVGDNDAVNLKQVNNLLKDLTPQSEQRVLSAEVKSSLTPAQMLSAGPTDKTGTTEAIAWDSLAIGVAAQATAANTFAAGSNVSASAKGGVGIGQNVAVDGENGVSIGSTTSASARDSLSIGSQSSSDGERSVAIGRSVSVGREGGNLGAGTVAIGSNIRALGNNSIVLGANSDGSKSDVLSIGSTGAERRIIHVAKGTGGTDAVNVDQLNDALKSLPTNALAVSYDDDKKSKITFNKGGEATTLTNVAAAKADTDAVNLKLLKDAGLNVDNNGGVKGGFVAYDDDTKSKVTLGGTDAKTAVQLTNVAAAKADTDAVNLKLLKDAGLNVDNNGGVKGGFVAYDDDTKTKVTFNSGGSATTLSNVAAGSLDNDAVNLKQLNTGMGQVAAALGGGAAADGKGGMTSPSYIINDASGTPHTYQDVGSALSAVTESMQVIAPNLKYMKFGPSTAAQAQATGTDAVAIGGNAFAMGPQTLAIGRGARAQGDQAMALGASTNANSERALALGYGAAALDNNAVAVGFGSVASQANTFSVGDTENLRRVVNVAAGQGDTDAVNLGQVNKMLADLNKPAHETRQILSAETRSSVPIEKLFAVGPTDKGSETQALGADAIAIGLTARADADKAVAVGSNVIVGTANSVGIGSNVSVNGESSLAIGVQASADKDRALALGHKAAADSADSIVIGSNSRAAAQAEGTVLIGNAIGSATGKNSVVLGANSNGALDNVISVGAKGNERRMVFLAAGTGDTDAVNVSQLKGVTKALGGGAELNADGSVKSPTYNIGGKTYTDVGSALAAAANSGGSGGGGTDPLSVLYDNDQRTTLTLNKGGSATTLTNVAAGKADSDAVNMKQLKDLGVTIDGDGNATNAFVAYDDASKEHVTFNKGGKASVLSNVAAGRSDGDAVNLKQLTDAGLTFDDTGKSTNTFVAYDDKGKGSVTFNKGGDATKLKNVSAGKDETDAVNVKQMNDAIRASAGTGDPLGVMYDDDTKEALTLAGTKGKGTKIRNLAAGTEDTDAINLKQLKDAGLLGTDGKTSLAVTYSDDKRQAVYFGNLGGAPVLLSNVADGKISEGSTQAVNGGQLFELTGRVDKLESITGGGNGGTGGGNGGGTGGGNGGGSGTGSNGLFAAHGDASTEGAVATGTHSTASGANANATGMHATATGANSVASATKSTAIGHGSTAKAENSVAIGAGAVADRANTVSFGSAGNERELTNIASVDPTVAANAMSAVNATTMNSAIARSAADTLQSANQYTDQAVSGLNTRIDGMDRTLSRGIAAAAALNNVTPYLPGRTSLNAGIAAYRGHPAVAITVSRWNSKGNINLNAGVSSAGGNSTIVRAGVGVVFGQ